MEFADARALLARVAILDNRTVDAASVMLWQEILSGYTLDECLFALRDFARENTNDYLRPAHLVAIISQRRQEWAWMNPGREANRPDGWLELERQEAKAAVEVKALREGASRLAVEAMDSGEYDDGKDG